jgi:hypothetical protein
MEAPVKSTLSLTCTVVLVASLSACRYEPPAAGRVEAPAKAAAAEPATAVPGTQQLTPALPPGHPAIARPDTLKVALAPVPAANLLIGEVVESMDAAGYTYIRLRGAKGELWTAVRQAKVAKGEIVTVAAQMTMKDFESTSLNRKFDLVVFGTLAAPGAAPVAAAPTATPPNATMPPGHPMPGMGAAPGMDGMGGGASRIVPGRIEVAKAEGADGRTVEEIWTSQSSIKDKHIAVRGKVVKFLPDIMGKNWIHLQDGSGSAETRTHDITITTTDKAAAGDIVLVTGTVRTDVNLGAGYTYPVIIQDAKLEK